MTELDKQLFDILLGRTRIRIAQLYPNGIRNLTRDEQYEIATDAYGYVSDIVVNDYHLVLNLGTDLDEIGESLYMLQDNVIEGAVRRARRSA